MHATGACATWARRRSAPQQRLGAGPLPATAQRPHQRGVRAHVGADARALHPVHHLHPRHGAGGHGWKEPFPGHVKCATWTADWMAAVSTVGQGCAQQCSGETHTFCARAHWPSVPKAVTRAVHETTSGLMPQRPRISSNSAAPRTQSPPAAHALMTAAKAWPGRQGHRVASAARGPSRRRGRASTPPHPQPPSTRQSEPAGEELRRELSSTGGAAAGARHVVPDLQRAAPPAALRRRPHRRRVCVHRWRHAGARRRSLHQGRNSITPQESVLSW
jgi:hypothetical protein